MASCTIEKNFVQVNGKSHSYRSIGLISKKGFDRLAPESENPMVKATGFSKKTSHSELQTNECNDESNLIISQAPNLRNNKFGDSMKIAPPNYTQTPNDLFDKWLPFLGEGELKIILVVIRKTLGWQKSRDRISLSQLIEYTGLHKQNVINAVNSLINKNLIEKDVVGNPGSQETYYQLIFDDSNNSYQSRKETPPSLFTRPTKETFK